MPKIEPKLYDFLRKKMIETPEGLVHAVCDIENHVTWQSPFRRPFSLQNESGS